MYQISEQQIDFILNDICEGGVEMESLQQNLLDHICCIIENNLEANGDFESFYQKTIKTFYKDELWEIEEETLQLLTFKHYYTMKKVMIISGALSVSGFIAGALFKIMHWPGAAALILLAAVTISFIFLPLLFVLKTREISAKRDKLILGLGTIFGILFCISSLFKIMHWPYANMLWLVGLGVLMLLFVPVYFFTGIRNPETKVNTIITTIIIIGAGGMLFALTSLKSSKQFYINKTKELVMSEELLKRLQEVKTDTTGQNELPSVLLRSIVKTSNKVKEMVLNDEFGQSSIPLDYEARQLWIEESGLGDEFYSGHEGEKVL